MIRFELAPELVGDTVFWARGCAAVSDLLRLCGGGKGRCWLRSRPRASWEVARESVLSGLRAAFSPRVDEKFIESVEARLT